MDQALVDAGIDSVEHGAVITADDVETLGRRNDAWTPTLCASVTTKPTDSDQARRRRQETSKHLAAMLPIARAKGVRPDRLDAVGTVAHEVSPLVEHGLSVEAALAAASTEAQAYLGIGNSGDLVTCHHDPREDPATLREPAAVVIRGTRIR